MATTGEPNAASVRRIAIASLLRIANADLTDARLLLREGKTRNAAVIGGRTVAHLIRALAASEHEWPLARGHDVIDAIPSVNPFQHSLLTAQALLADAADQPIGSDGYLEASPDSRDISDALSDVEAILDAASQAFCVVLSDKAPAVNADPVRPPEPADKAAGLADPTNDLAAHASEHAGTDNESAPPKSLLAHNNETSAPARVIRANRPKRRVAALRQDAEPTPVESRPQKAAIKHRELPPQSRRRSRKMSPSTGAAATLPLAKDEPGSSRNAKQLDTSIDVMGRQGAAERAVRPQDYTSTVFWALMDRWKLSDVEAIALIGHTGGLTKKGTRPRFKIVGLEAKLFSQITEIDAALSPLGGDAAAWIRQPIKEAPFRGQTAVAYITQHGLDGAREVARTVLMTALRSAHA